MLHCYVEILEVRTCADLEIATTSQLLVKDQHLRAGSIANCSESSVTSCYDLARLIIKDTARLRIKETAIR